MNTLRNIFSTRAFNILRQNGQNAFINVTQQQQQPSIVDSHTETTKIIAATTTTDIKGSSTPAVEILNQSRLTTEPLCIPKTILDVTERLKQKSLLNNTVNTTTTITNKKNGSISPTTLKLYRRIQRKVDIVYTCKLCNTRNNKQINEAAYRNGVVILQCDGCNVNHLIIDNLGWFTTNKLKEKSFNDILTENSRRIKVIKVNENDELI